MTICVLDEHTVYFILSMILHLHKDDCAVIKRDLFCPFTGKRLKWTVAMSVNYFVIDEYHYCEDSVINRSDQNSNVMSDFSTICILENICKFVLKEFVLGNVL